MAEDDVMHITLTKRDKGQTWASPMVGQGQLDPYSTDQEQKRLMLQRFQEEVNFHLQLFILLFQFQIFGVVRRFMKLELFNSKLKFSW